MNEENRVFFRDTKGAVKEDYRHYKNCRSVDAEDVADFYEQISEEKYSDWRDYLEYTGEEEVLEEDFPEVFSELFEE